MHHKLLHYLLLSYFTLKETFKRVRYTANVHISNFSLKMIKTYGYDSTCECKSSIVQTINNAPNVFTWFLIYFKFVRVAEVDFPPIFVRSNSLAFLIRNELRRMISSHAQRVIHSIPHWFFTIFSSVWCQKPMNGTRSERISIMCIFFK